MIDGGALLVHENNLHGASRCGPSVEAYAWTPNWHAACTWELSDENENSMIAWRHYTDARFDTRNSFSSVLDAWNLRWHCIKNAFHEAYIQLSEVCATSAFTGQLFDSNTTKYDSSQTHTHRHALNDPPGCVVALSASECDLLHVRSSSEVSKQSDAQIYSESISLQQPVGAALKVKKVQFDSKTLLHVGIEDELNMATVVIHHQDLHAWNEKPWAKRPHKISTCSDMCFSDINPRKPWSTPLSPSSRQCALGIQPIGGYVQSHAPHKTCVESQHRGHHHPEDGTAFVQIGRPVGVAFKNAPADHQHAEIVQAFQEGQMLQEGDFTEHDQDNQMDPDGYSPSVHHLRQNRAVKMSFYTTWMTSLSESFLVGITMRI